MSGRIVAEGDVPKVAPTFKFFAELRASLKNAQDVTADISAVVVRLRLENERLGEALRNLLALAEDHSLDAAASDGEFPVIVAARSALKDRA